MTTPQELVLKLERLNEREDRAQLASLRRGLGQPPGTVVETSRVIEHMLSEDDPPWVAETLYVIGPLFALHPKSATDDGRRDMGGHFRALYADHEDPPANVERRFMTLLASEPDDLPDSLRQAVKLLKFKEVPVNWLQLFYDVQKWLDRRHEGEQRRQEVRARWSRHFWRLVTPQSTQNNTQPTPNSSS